MPISTDAQWIYLTEYPFDVQFITLVAISSPITCQRSPPVQSVERAVDFSEILIALKVFRQTICFMNEFKLAVCQCDWSLSIPIARVLIEGIDFETLDF